MITDTPSASSALMAEATVVPLGKVALFTLPPSPPHVATQPPSTRNASVIAFSPAWEAMVATVSPTPRLISIYGAYMFPVLPPPPPPEAVVSWIAVLSDEVPGGTPRANFKVIGVRRGESFHYNRLPVQTAARIP